MSKILVLAFAVTLMAMLSSPVRSQQPLSQCTPAMMTSVSPCMSFITNSSSNGTSPSSDCCNSLRSLTTSGMGCLCLIVTGTVPFNVPINRTTAVSLPRACNMPRVPLQCQANIAPAASPGPATFGPTMSPSPATTPIVPEPTPSAQTPVSDSTRPFTPQTPATDGGAPTADGGSSSRPSLTPSSAFRSTFAFSSPYLLLVSINALAALKFY